MTWALERVPLAAVEDSFLEAAAVHQCGTALELLQDLPPPVEAVRDMPRVEEHFEERETGAVVVDLGPGPVSPEIQQVVVVKVPVLAGVEESISAALDNSVSELDPAIEQTLEPALVVAIWDPGTEKVEE